MLSRGDEKRVAWDGDLIMTPHSLAKPSATMVTMAPIWTGALSLKGDITTIAFNLCRNVGEMEGGGASKMKADASRVKGFRTFERRA